MYRLSNNFATGIGMIFVLLMISAIIYIDIFQWNEYLWPPTIACTLFAIAICFMLIENKTVYYDKEKLYYQTLFFTPLKEIPLEKIYNIIKLPSMNFLQKRYKVRYYDENDADRSISFIISMNYMSQDIYKILDLNRS